MFLGYSEADQSLLRPYNNLTVFDAVSTLDAFMRQEVNNQVYIHWYKNFLLIKKSLRIIVIEYSDQVLSHLLFSLLKKRENVQSWDNKERWNDYGLNL